MTKYLRKILPICFLIIAVPGLAQKKYWITFTDKQVSNYNYQNHLSPKAIQNRINQGISLFQYSDIPVNQKYVDSLSHYGVKPVARSKWLNSITAELTEKQIASLKQISFVNSVDAVNTRLKTASVNTDLDTKNYSLTLEQMNAKAFLEAGLSGKGVPVGVIDAGFYAADREPRLIHLFDENKIKAQRDFINPERNNLIETSVTLSDDHGKKVLDYFCGYYISEKVQTGLGVNADLYLARTENGDKEHRVEEDHWIMAMEWMDSLGVRLINTSLGYAINMDDPSENYSQEEMDGKTARITKAAQLAVQEKGIFLVVSAGNEGGNNSWRIISAPADAEGVLSVGATDAQNPSRIYYSSVGPDFLPYLKPNVSAYSPNGTSFSAPAVTGFVACLMQQDSTLTNKELKGIIEKSGHLYPYGNNFIGYGIPDAARALKLMEDSATVFNSKVIKTDKNNVQIVFKTKAKKGDAVVFHKRDARNVLSQEIVPMKRRKLNISRRSGETHATVSFEDQVIEVIWE